MNLDSNYKRDREFDLVRNEVLELSDKFDYFIVMLLKSGLIQSQGEGDTNDLFKFNSNVQAAPSDQNLGEDQEKLRELFESYKKSALNSNLGGRQKIRESQMPNFTGLALKKWLDTKFKLGKIQLRDSLDGRVS